MQPRDAPDQKRSQWHVGMKAHANVDADSVLIHTGVGAAANVNDVAQASQRPYPGQGRTHVSGHQAPARAHINALLRTDQEHDADHSTAKPNLSYYPYSDTELMTL